MPYGGTTSEEDKKIESCVSQVMPTLTQYSDPKEKKSHAIAICKSRIMKKGKEIKPSNTKISFKEEEGEFYSEGFVATSHPDRAVNEEAGYDGDILSKSAIQKIVDSINNKFNPSAGAVSYRHDWIRQDNPLLPLSGIAIQSEVRQTDDGQWGAFVKTHHNKQHPDFEKTAYEVEHGYLPGYSIEYETVAFHPVNHNGKTFRMIDDLEFYGYGFADARNIANPHAQIVDYGYKEIMKNNENYLKEESKMEETKEKVEEKKETADSQGKEVKETKPEEKETKMTVSEEDFKLLQKLKESKESESKIKEFKEMLTKCVAETKGNAPLFNTGDTETKPELKEITEFVKIGAEIKELNEKYIPALEGGREKRSAMQKMLVEKQYRAAAKLLDKFVSLGVPIANNSIQSMMLGIVPQPSMAYKSVGESHRPMEIKELGRMEVKAGEGLMFGTNADGWTYGSYNVSPAEFNDIFQPAIVNQLNDQTTTYGKLQKVDFSGYSQIEFRARDARNSTAGGYAEGANLTYASSFTGYTSRVKYIQPFSYYRVLVAVTGQQIQLAKSPGGIGDIWADEVKWAAIDLQKKLSQEIISTGDGTSESACLGFEGIILGSTGTLYGRNIATYTGLKSHKENMSSARVTFDQLRKMIRYTVGGDTTLTHSNARKEDLVFITHPLQRDFILALYQDMQRTVPTSSKIGYEGDPEFDGVPIFGDVNMNTDDIFLLDTSAMKLGVNLPPTLELLPVTADAKAAHIKTYFNVYCDRPGNCYWAHTFATT